MSITRNRELSQFGSFIHIDDTTQNIGITSLSTPFVGIGTNNPGYKLDVAGDINFTGTFYQNGTQFVSGSSRWDVSIGSSIYRLQGNVGIGTSASPAYALDISGNLRTTKDVLINGVNAGKGAGGSLGLNTVFGSNSLQSNTTGEANSSFGTFSLPYNTTGNYNNAFGYQALQSNISGDSNNAFGEAALLRVIEGGNSAFGGQAGLDLINGSKNSFFGAATNVDISSNTYNNSTALGYNAQITASNQVRIGNTLVTSIGGYANWTNLSDLRDKKNIEEIPVGLEFVNKLNPVKFEWNTRDGSKTNMNEFGFIAQELLQAQNESNIVVPNLVNDNNPDKLEASYGTLIPIMIKAIKELTELTAKQQLEIDELKNKLTA